MQQGDGCVYSLLPCHTLPVQSGNNVLRAIEALRLTVAIVSTVSHSNGRHNPIGLVSRVPCGAAGGGV
eukprot:m.506663 g.506663  ORF g.506663 m.506663 type:complete len:68 (+) comp21876_c0_seq2:1714-1917(+)